VAVSSPRSFRRRCILADHECHDAAGVHIGLGRRGEQSRLACRRPLRSSSCRRRRRSWPSVFGSGSPEREDPDLLSHNLRGGLARGHRADCPFPGFRLPVQTILAAGESSESVGQRGLPVRRRAADWHIPSACRHRAAHADDAELVASDSPCQHLFLTSSESNCTRYGFDQRNWEGHSSSR